MSSTTNLDLLRRVDFTRLRKQRVENARRSMKKHGLDALLLVKPFYTKYLADARGNDYVWSMWEYVLLPGDDDPFLYLVGPEAEHIKLDCPWLKGRVKPSMYMEDHGSLGKKLADDFAAEIKKQLKDARVAGSKIGMDLVNPILNRSLTEVGLSVLDGKETMMDATLIKTKDEIELLKHAATINDSAFHRMYTTLKPGMTEWDVCAEWIYEVRRLGADTFTRGMCTSGDFAGPPLRRFMGGTNRLIKPGDLVYFDGVFSSLGYWSDYVRTYLCGGKSAGINATDLQKELYKACYDLLYDSIKAVKPGNTTTDVSERWKEPEDFTEFTIQFGHGLGVSLHEYPMISFTTRKQPVELRPGMVLALETYASSKGAGALGVRLEENLVVTETGCEVISKGPFDEKLTA